MKQVSFIFALAIATSGLLTASPLPACGSQFDYSCVAATLGGYTIITPISSTGMTEVTAFNSSNVKVFDKLIPIAGTGPAGYEVTYAVLEAATQLAFASGQESTLPQCSSTPMVCQASNPPYDVSNSIANVFTEQSYVAVDTPVTRRNDAYQTVLIATLNGVEVSSQTLSVAFGDPAFNTAVLMADGILAGDGAAFGFPFLVSQSVAQQGSQLSFEETGRSYGGAGNVSFTTSFGPTYVLGCNTFYSCRNTDQLYPQVTFAPQGQYDINSVTEAVVTIKRNIVTTNSYLTTETYEIDGVTLSAGAVPEPASIEMFTLGFIVVAIYACTVKGTVEKRK